jgi:hypothetical protein
MKKKIKKSQSNKFIEEERSESERRLNTVDLEVKNGIVRVKIKILRMDERAQQRLLVKNIIIKLFN